MPRRSLRSPVAFALALLGAPMTAGAAAGPWALESTLTPQSVFPYIDGMSLGPTTLAIKSFPPEDGAWETSIAILIYQRVGGGWTGPTVIRSPDFRYLGYMSLSGDDLLTYVQGDEGYFNIYTLHRSGESWSAPELLLALSNNSFKSMAATDDRLAVAAEGPSECEGGRRMELRLFRREGEGWIDHGVARPKAAPHGVFGSFDVDGDRAVMVFEREPGLAEAHVFARQAGSTWEEEQVVMIDADETHDTFRVALSGATLAVSLGRNDETGSLSDAIELHVDRGGDWQHEQRIDGEFVEFKLDGPLLAVTAMSPGSDGINADEVRVFAHDGEWQEEAALSVPTHETQFNAVELRGELLVIGEQPDGDALPSYHIYHRTGDLPAGACTDDDCLDGPDKQGCDCREVPTGGGAAGQLAALALLLAGARRRRCPHRR